MDKPGRRKRTKRPWGKVTAAIAVALVVVVVAAVYYDTYVNIPPPAYARLGTSFGYVYVELYPSCAPQTVKNFENLVNNGTYTNLVWHRIVDKSTPAFVIQTGDPNSKNGVNSTRYTWGQGGTKVKVPLEFCGSLHNYAGFLGMARGSDPNSGSSQFYINLSNGTANQSLDPNYTVFGKVISGMKAVCSIAYVPVYGSTARQNNVTIADQPVTPVYLTNATMLSAATAPVPQPITSCK